MKIELGSPPPPRISHPGFKLTTFSKDIKSFTDTASRAGEQRVDHTNLIMPFVHALSNAFLNKCGFASSAKFGWYSVMYFFMRLAEACFGSLQATNA